MSIRKENMTYSEDKVAETVDTTSAENTIEVSKKEASKKVTSKKEVNLVDVSVDTFFDYRLRTLVDNFAMGWSSKAGKELESLLKQNDESVKTGLYIWMKKSKIPAMIDPLVWFKENLLEKDPTKGSLINAFYIGTGDILSRGWSAPVGKHAFGDWLIGEDNIEDEKKIDFQYFFLSIADKAIYENLENALKEWNKINRSDKLPFELGENSAVGGQHGSRLRLVLKGIGMLEIEEMASAQDAMDSRLTQLWSRPENRQKVTAKS